LAFRLVIHVSRQLNVNLGTDLPKRA